MSAIFAYKPLNQAMTPEQLQTAINSTLSHMARRLSFGEDGRERQRLQVHLDMLLTCQENMAKEMFLKVIDSERQP